MRHKYALVIVTATLLIIASACMSTYEKKQNVKQRAKFDLNCPAEQLQVVKISKNSFGVTGCGQKASYSCGDNVCVMDDGPK